MTAGLQNNNGCFKTSFFTSTIIWLRVKGPKVHLAVHSFQRNSRLKYVQPLGLVHLPLAGPSFWMAGGAANGLTLSLATNAALAAERLVPCERWLGRHNFLLGARAPGGMGWPRVCAVSQNPLDVACVNECFPYSFVAYPHKIGWVTAWPATSCTVLPVTSSPPRPHLPLGRPDPWAKRWWPLPHRWNCSRRPRSKSHVQQHWTHEEVTLVASILDTWDLEMMIQ